LQRTLQEYREVSPAFLTETFVDVDRKIKERMSQYDVALSGSTLVSAFLAAGTVTCANLGDSRCLLGSLDRFGEVSVRCVLFTFLVRKSITDTFLFLSFANLSRGARTL
jgi:serine/threonine protein phosphatase PrpC